MSQIKQGTLVGTWISMVFAIFLSNDFLSICVNIGDLPEMVNNNNMGIILFNEQKTNNDTKQCGIV